MTKDGWVLTALVVSALMIVGALAANQRHKNYVDDGVEDYGEETELELKYCAPHYSFTEDAKGFEEYCKRRYGLLFEELHGKKAREEQRRQYERDKAEADAYVKAHPKKEESHD